MSKTATNPLSTKLKDMFISSSRLSADVYREDLEECIDEFVEDKKKSGDPILLAISHYEGLFSAVLIDENDQVHINKHAIRALKKCWLWDYRRGIEKLIPNASQVLEEGAIFQISAYVYKPRTIA